MDQETMGKFLIDCLCREFDDKKAALLRGADWDSLIQFAIKHNLAPLLYHRLKTIYPSVKLHKAYLISARRNTRLYNDFSKIINALGNIPVIALKGAHLAQNVYANIALRPMNDVDILVKKTDLLKAGENLLEMGYISGTSRVGDIEGICAKYQHLPPFTKPDAFPVDIHWTIVLPSSPFRIDIDGVWKRAQPARIAGVDVLVLSPEDLLLHLCLHTSFQHLFRNGLSGFYDIWETLRHYQGEINWEQLMLRSRQWRASKTVYISLYLAKTLFDAVVPNEVLDRLKPEDLEPQVVNWAKAQLFDKRIYPSINLIDFWKSKSSLDKLKVFLKRVFLSPEEMAQLYPVHYNSPRVYFYYLVRLKKLFFEHISRTWLLLRHDKDMVNVSKRTYALQEWLSR
ncbi:hypothetical protein THIOM_000035 [Candidatus Thiomargarita nelsonii]|uniref:Nucleotidyltransferase family protein n=1 Tax=Candidatus Thiomargarita nelsonii TaxID=1003181 RepID=A0A0A6P1K1_9GAMM|nr:hypothetical protein THIOM_000035 [Candidatus Thiomargarita nelsonii]